MTPSEFEFLAGLVRQRSGLVLSQDKTYLLESRLLPVARRAELAGIPELVVRIRDGKDEALAVAVTEAMTTNESFFFRDKTPFDLFTNRVLPHMAVTRANRRRLRIWSAAASTGQELYSIAMLLREARSVDGWSFDLIGTDLSNEVLERARSGLYTQFEVQRGLPIQLLVKYFQQTGERWQIAEDLRRMVQFRAFNLLDPMTAMGRFDVVYCRNVLIYFDQPTKKLVLERLAEIMPEDGCLLLGAAETVVGITDAFKPVPGARGLYCRKPELLAAPDATTAPSVASAIGARPAPAAPAAALRPASGAAAPVFKTR